MIALEQSIKRGVMMKKKGSLSLSIETIVIVVIAFTVLGLGLTFVKSQLGGAEKTFGDVQSKVREKILEDLRSSGKKLAITQEIQMERGKQVVENAGIVNTGIATKKFGILIVPIKKQNTDGTEETGVGTGNYVTRKEVTFFYNTAIEKELSPTQGDVIPITITSSSGASGTYLYKVNVYSEDIPPATGSTPLTVPTIPCIINTDGTSNPVSCLYDTRSFFVRVS